MIYCYVRYTLDMSKRKEFETYARLWVRLINKLGGTHLGYYLPSEDEKARDHGRFSFPSMGATGAANVAVPIFGFPDWNAYEHYRSAAGNYAECEQATKIVEDSKCFFHYERNFMTQILG
jgi:hypothetical protein